MQNINLKKKLAENMQRYHKELDLETAFNNYLKSKVYLCWPQLSKLAV